ncbi:MAG: hypothetical protein HYV07_06465 [Deltaproteobacteria bacterium]|nr:hypothetical protein [Deltaproteobacteria bacterium]
MASLDRDLLWALWSRRLGPAGRSVEGDLAAWLERLEKAIEGDEVNASEILDFASLLGRRLGLERRPASTALTLALALSDALRELGVTTPEAESLTRRLAAVLVDAHALGTREDAEDRHQKQLRDASPIVRLEDRAVIGFLIGPSSSDLLDAMVGRLLRESVAASAPDLAIDVFGTERLDDRFFQTIAALTKSDQAAHVRRVVITGARDQDAVLDALVRSGADPKRLRLEERVNDYIEGKIR